MFIHVMQQMRAVKASSINKVTCLVYGAILMHALRHCTLSKDSITIKGQQQYSAPTSKHSSIERFIIGSGFVWLLEILEKCLNFNGVFKVSKSLDLAQVLEIIIALI